MPFGLTNAPVVFKALLNDALRDMLNNCVFVNLDEILTFPPNLKSHVCHDFQVLKQLSEHQLFGKAKSVNVTNPLYPS